MPAPEKLSLSGLSRSDLEALIECLLADNAALQQTVAELRAEIASLKGVKGRPTLKPSGMEQSTEPKPTGRGRKHGAKVHKTERLVIHEDRIVHASVPVGSRFKGYEDFVVQDLVLRPHVVRIRRERWLTPAGKTVVAPMPAGITGHFGPELRRFVLLQYHQGKVTMPCLVAQLRAFGIDISKRQLVRLSDAAAGRRGDHGQPARPKERRGAGGDHCHRCPPPALAALFAGLQPHRERFRQAQSPAEKGRGTDQGSSLANHRRDPR